MIETQSVLIMFQMFFLYKAYHLKNLNAVDWLLAGPTDIQLKIATHTSFCIYPVYLLVMGYKYG